MFSGSPSLTKENTLLEVFGQEKYSDDSLGLMDLAAHARIAKVCLFAPPKKDLDERLLFVHISCRNIFLKTACGYARRSILFSDQSKKFKKDHSDHLFLDGLSITVLCISRSPFLFVTAMISVSL